MRLTQLSAPWMTVLCIASVAAAGIDNSQVFNIGGDTTSMADSTNDLMPTQTTVPTADSSDNSFDGITTAPPIISVGLGDQSIEQGADGVKTVINGHQTIIDGPNGKTVIQGDQTIIQTKATKGSGSGQTMIDEESTGGAALATGIPFAGAVMALGGAMMLI